MKYYGVVTKGKKLVLLTETQFVRIGNAAPSLNMWVADVQSFQFLFSGKPISGWSRLSTDGVSPDPRMFIFLFEPEKLLSLDWGLDPIAPGS